MSVLTLRDFHRENLELLPCGPVNCGLLQEPDQQRFTDITLVMENGEKRATESSLPGLPLTHHGKPQVYLH